MVLMKLLYSSTLTHNYKYTSNDSVTNSFHLCTTVTQVLTKAAVFAFTFFINNILSYHVEFEVMFLIER